MPASHGGAGILSQDHQPQQIYHASPKNASGDAIGRAAGTADFPGELLSVACAGLL